MELKADSKLDPNLLRGRWLFNVDPVKTMTVRSSAHWFKDLLAAGVPFIKEIVIGPNQAAYIPYWYVDFEISHDGKGCAAHVALDPATRDRYLKQFGCKLLK